MGRPFPGNLKLITVVLLGVLATGPVWTAADELPNIIIILADDLGYGELGVQGNPQIPTPNIDSIAESGVQFTQGYVTASTCSQSRAGLLTGRHQLNFGYNINPIGATNDEADVGLPLSEKTIADHLKNKGYVTGLFGKWHLGATSKYLPLRRGFDEFFGFLHEGHYYAPSPYYSLVNWIRRKTLPGGGKGTFYSADRRTIYSTHLGNNEPIYDANNPIYRGGQPVEEKEYLTDAITREGVNFIRRNYDQPFFMVLSYNAVHSPMQGTDRYVHKFRKIKDIHRRIFAAMLGNLDDGVGDIFAALQQGKTIDKTVVFFLSDNGGPTKELTSSNKPLRGEKGSLYEGGIRVPFLMQWKGKIRAGTTFKQPVTSLDICATVAEISGFQPNKGTGVGVDLMPFLAGSKTGRPHETLFWKSKQQEALRSGDWKIIRNLKNDQYELYDLANDIAEQKEMSNSNPDRFEQLKNELAETMEPFRRDE